MKADWTNTGMKVVPHARRAEFLAVAEAAKWLPIVGHHPAVPGLALKELIKEFAIRNARQVSYSECWPGPNGDGGMTDYIVLGLRTRKQRLLFVDHGSVIIPVVIVTDEPREEAPGVA